VASLQNLPKAVYLALSHYPSFKFRSFAELQQLLVSFYRQEFKQGQLI
jgi:hypothetical protein